MHVVYPPSSECFITFLGDIYVQDGDGRRCLILSSLSQTKFSKKMKRNTETPKKESNPTVKKEKEKAGEDKAPVVEVDVNDRPGKGLKRAPEE